MADLTLEQIKSKFDASFTANQTTRISAADDRLFARVTQWDSSYLQDSQLAYKGEFNIIRKAVREIMSDLRANPIQINFEPKADQREVSADILDGIYLSDDRVNTSIEAYDNAAQETVDCGIGGWELYTEYESSRNGTKHQVIRRRPLYEFNNNVFPDPNAKLLDKSDAKYWTILEPYTKEGYQALYKDLTGKETDATPPNFASPENSYVFPWVTGNDLYYVARFYHKSKVKDKVLTFVNDSGQRAEYLESSLYGRGEDGDIDLMDDLIDLRFEIVSEKPIKRWQVKCYICSGEDILKVYEIPSEHIPVVPMYGERAFIEGEEHYEGVVRLAKDPQRLRNFIMSYLGDTVARGPRKKPIFTPEQIATYEFMYDVNGADNNYPYLLQHNKDAQGQELPRGPVGYLEGPELNQAVVALMGESRQAVEDVANPGLPKDIMDSDLSGHAIELLQNRLDNQSQVYQDHLKHAKRYDAVVYASMFSRVYDAPRKATATLPDGTRKVEEIMSEVLDEDTGEIVVLNDLTNVEFEVYANIGPSYSSKREKTMSQLGEMAEKAAPFDPNMARILMLQQLTMMDGINTKSVREYATKQLIKDGVHEPQTDDEIAFAEQMAQQPQEPSAEMVLAKAEEGKAQAALIQAQVKARTEMQKSQNDTVKNQIESFRAETERGHLMVDAKVAGADIRLKRAQVRNTNIKSFTSVRESYRARVN